MSLYLMWVYSITRSQLCLNWVLDYVSMRLLSPTQFIWRPSVPQLCCSGTHRINTRSNVTVPDVSVFHNKESIVFQLGAWLCNHETALPHTIHLETIGPQFSSSGTHRINTCSNVTVPDVSVFHHKESIVFQLGAWLCKHETALPTQFIWRPSVPSSPALALTESIQVVMSLYLMSVYSITRSQLCFNWVLDYVSMRLLSLTQFIWRPSVLQLCCSGTHRINTRSNVTVPDVSVFHHKESIMFQLGAWLCKHETALPHTIHLETIGPQFSSSGTHRINTRSNVTVPDVSVFHHKKSIVLRLGAWLCKHETALPHTIHLETIRPPVVLLWHSQNQYT